MSAKQTKGFPFPEEKVASVRMTEGSITPSPYRPPNHKVLLFHLPVSIITLRGYAHAAWHFLLSVVTKGSKNTLFCAISPKAVSLIPSLRFEETKRYFP